MELYIFVKTMNMKSRKIRKELDAIGYRGDIVIKRFKCEVWDAKNREYIEGSKELAISYCDDENVFKIEICEDDLDMNVLEILSFELKHIKTIEQVKNLYFALSGNEMPNKNTTRT